MSTLSQIRGLIRTYISQSDTSNTDFTDSDLNGFANEGQRFLGALVKKPIDHVEIQVEQDVPAYTLPVDAILINTAYFGDANKTGDVLPLTVVTEEGLKEVVPNWLDETTKTQNRPTRIILLDMRTVLINPRPNAAESASGKLLMISYVFQPSNMTNDSDTPTLPVVYHDLIAKYGAHLCYMSKLNKPDLGAALLSQVIDLAKKLEPLIVKEVNSLGFSWGGGFDPNSDSFVMRTNG